MRYKKINLQLFEDGGGAGSGGQGMTQEEATQALAQFRQQREANKPNVSAIEKERDDARKELEAYRQKDILKESGVDAKYADFVHFEVSKKVDDKTDFKAALKTFLKDNPQYAGGGYRVNVQAKTGASQAGSAGGNTQVPDAGARYAADGVFRQRGQRTISYSCSKVNQQFEKTLNLFRNRPPAVSHVFSRFPGSARKYKA